MQWAFWEQAVGGCYVLFAAGLLLMACQMRRAGTTPPFGENDLNYPELTVAPLIPRRWPLAGRGEKAGTRAGVARDRTGLLPPQRDRVIDTFDVDLMPKREHD